MRTVSDLYKAAVISREQHTRISGTVRTSGRIYEINDSIVSPGSLSINRKAVNRSSFEYGTAVTSEMNITLILPDADRYSMYDSVVELYLYTLLSDGTEEEMKLGTWNVSECTKSKKLLAFKGYDNMLRFDRPITDDTTGTPYELLVYACTKCGVELRQTEEDIQALINGTMQLRVRADEVDTYRDLICYIGMVTCTYAVINEDGKLVMNTFSKNPDCELIKRQVLSSKISDFQSFYSGVEARFIADSNYATYSVNDSTAGLVLDMGDIPIVRGLPETKTEVLTNILGDLKQIIYTPAELTIIGNPAIEPGDMITVKNANLTDDDITTIITSTTWKHHAGMKIVSAGSNPKLADAKDKSTKQMQSIESSVANKDVVIVSYTNAKDYTIKQELKEIAELSYVTVSGCKPIFLGIVQFELDRDGIVDFALYNGMVAIPNATYSCYYTAGKHFVTLFYPDSAEEDERKNLRILAKTYKNENSVERQNTADIKTIYNAIAAIKTSSDLSKLTYTVVEPDTTEPTMTIEPEAIKAIVYAQGIGTKAEWDGNLEFTDYMDLVQVNGTKNIEFTDSLSAMIDVPLSSGMTEILSTTPVINTSIIGFSESIVFNEVIENYIVNTDKADKYSYNKQYISIDNQKYSLQDDVEIPSAQDVLTNEIDLSNPTITGIESVSVISTGTPLFALSFDSGTTWKMHNGTSWVVLSETGTGMLAETLEAITPDQWQEEINEIISMQLRFVLTNFDDTLTSIIIDFTN